MCGDAEKKRGDAERRVDSDRAGVDYLCMLRLLGAVSQPVAKFRNEAEFRKPDVQAGRTARPPSGQKRMGLESNVRAGGILWTGSDSRWQGEWFRCQLDVELAYHVGGKIHYLFFAL